MIPVMESDQQIPIHEETKSTPSKDGKTCGLAVFEKGVPRVSPPLLFGVFRPGRSLLKFKLERRQPFVLRFLPAPGSVPSLIAGFPYRARPSADLP